MDLLCASSRGRNILARPQAKPRFYPSTTVPAARVYVWEVDVGEPVSAARLVGVFAPGGSGKLPFNPTADRNKRLFAVSYSASGTPSAHNLSDATQATVLFQRETDAPTVAQVGASTQGLITLSLTAFTRFAIARRVRIASDSGMTTDLVTQVIDGGGQPLPFVFVLTRATSSPQAAQTVYVRVSHSSAGVSGPWSSESPATAFTFTDDGGSGGSTGDGNENPRDNYEL